jgi:FAD:protein FMN transferase
LNSSVDANLAPQVSVRRAQPLLGTLVEVGLHDASRLARGAVAAAFDAAFDAVREVSRCLSRFDAESDIARFHDAAVGASISVRPTTRHVLAAARDLQRASSGAFDISLGTGPDRWHLDDRGLNKSSAAVQLDLGGIGKGHAVDCAVAALIGCGIEAGWVNAGGDLRAFGAAALPIELRDEHGGGTRPFATLQGGAFATSHFDRLSRSQLVPAGSKPEAAPRAHVSVAAELCLWADALTKVVALSGDTAHPLLARYGAHAWLH